MNSYRLRQIKLRLTALWRVLTKRNIILIDGLSVRIENGEKIRTSRLLRRTDFDEEDDFLYIKSVLFLNFKVEQIEDKQQKEVSK